MNLKKQTMKDRWGNTVSYEFESPVKPVDQTALMKQAMESQEMMRVPPMQAQGGMPPMPGGGHPGAPRGPDTVPAWLTPGEFVMNAEATRMFPQQIEQMNNAGRAVQRQQGGTIPQYKANGGEVVDTLLAGGITPDRLNELGWQTTPGPAPIQGEHIPYGQEFDPVPQPPQALNAAQRVAQVGGDTALGYAPPPQQPEEPGLWDRAGNWFNEKFHTIPEAGTVSDPTLRTQKKERIAGELGKLDALEASGIAPELLADKRKSLEKEGADVDAQPAKLQEEVQKIAKNRIDAGDYEGALELLQQPQAVPEVPEGVPPAAEVPAPPGAAAPAVPGQVPAQAPEAPVEADPEGVAAAEQAGAAERQTPEGEGFFQQVFNGMKAQFKDVFTPEEIAKYATLYLGSRALGGSHDGSLAYIGQQFNAAQQANTAAQAAQAARKAKIDDQLAVHAGKKAIDEGGQSPQTRQINKALQQYGIDPKGDQVEFIKTSRDGTGTQRVNAWKGAGGFHYTQDPETGKIVPFDKTGYEEFASARHSTEAIETDLKEHLTTVGQEFKRTVTTQGKEGKVTRTQYDVNPQVLSTALVNHFGSDVFASQEGRGLATSYMQGAAAYQTRTKTKVKDWDGFFSAMDAGVFGGDGHVNIHKLATQDDGKTPIALSHYDGLGDSLQQAVVKHDGISTQGEASYLALSAFEAPQTPSDEALLKKVNSMQIPKGSSRELEFVKLYLAELNK